MKHKTFSFLLAVLISMVASVASAYDTVKDGIYYNLNEGKAEVAGANANMLSGDFIIPEKINYGGNEYIVTSIAASAFKNAGITSITIPHSIVTIGESAFDGCVGLTKACFSSVQHVCNIERVNNKSNPLYYAKHLFINGEEIRDVVVPGNVETIKSWAFEGCTSFTSIKIESGVKNIEQSAFYGDIGINSVSLPESVIAIGPQAFQNCTSLTSISVPNSVTSIGDHAFRNCTEIKDVLIGEDVTKIGKYAFYACKKMEKCELKGNIQEIGEAAFGNCTNLSSIHIPKGVYISSKLFTGCTSLSSVILDEGIGDIANEAFKNCTSLQSIKLPSSVNNIGDNAFEGCSTLKSIDLSEQLESIGNSTFSGCENLREIIIPKYVSSIGDGAFDGCVKIESLILEDGEDALTLGHAGNIYRSNTLNYYKYFSGYCNLYVTEYNGLFSDAALKNIYIGRSIMYSQYSYNDTNPGNDNSPCYLSLYNSPFNKYTSIDKIVIGDKVKFLGTGAKKTLSYSTNKQHTSSVKYYIKPDIFDALTFTEVYSMNKTAPLYASFNEDTYKNSYLYILEGSFNSYSTTDGWKDFLNVNEREDKEWAFNISLNYDSYNLYIGSGFQLEATLLPKSISVDKVIWESSDETICIVSPNGYVQSTGKKGTAIITAEIDGITATCRVNITNNIEINGIVYEVGDSDAKVISTTDKDAESLIIPREITIGEKVFSVTSIAYGAFKDYKRLSSIEIPNTIIQIGDYAFKGSTGLTSIKIPNSVTSIGNMAFYDCTGLTSVTIGNSVTSIGIYAFHGCTGLTSIEIPNSVTSIDGGAFSGCTGLSDVLFNAKNCTSCGSYSSPAFPSTIKTLTIGNEVETIPAYAFYKCTGLTSIEIPNSVTSISSSAFRDCTGVLSVTIGNGVSMISGYVFRGCTELTTLYCYAENPPQIKASSFDTEQYKNVLLYVPVGTLEAYQSAPYWSNFVNIQVYDPTMIKAIDNGRLTIIPEGVYDLSGRKININDNLNLKQLKKGVYIVNGRKVLKR